jgi:N-acetylglucosaminyl-diphospho-decaprenol L-rhamnosyltransferase
MSEREAQTAAAAVVVTHAGPSDLLRRCLVSLDRTAQLHVVVVDNGVHGELPIDAYGPGVDEVLRTENRGFGAAVNRGLAVVRAPGRPTVPVMVLNDDIEVCNGWLGPLLDALDADAGLGAVQPKLLLSGTVPPAINSVGVAADRWGACADIGHGEPDDGRLEGVLPIEAFTGGAVLLRDEFLADVGGFDERYFLYYEDVDLSLRGAERGWRYACIPTSTVLHAASASTAALGEEVAYLRERNRLWTCLRFRSPATIARGFWLAARRLRHEPRRAHRRALLAALVAAPRRLLERWRR